MISSVAPTRLSTFHAYLITKIGNRNLKYVAVSFDPKQETSDVGTSNSVLSSVELEIRAIISFKVTSWYEVTLIKC